MEEVGGEEVDTSSSTQVRAVTFALNTFLRVRPDIGDKSVRPRLNATSTAWWREVFPPLLALSSLAFK